MGYRRVAISGGSWVLGPVGFWMGLAAVLLLSACGGASKVAQPPETDKPAAATSSNPHAVKADIYEAMARMSRAQAFGEPEAVEQALDEAMEGVRRLARDEAALEDAELRELYRSVITAYEQYYGVSDTLMTAYGDIFAFREAAFASMNELDEPLLENARLPDLTPTTTTIPLPANQLVERSIQYLLRSPEKHLYRWMSRSATYFPMIEQILKEEDVPEELKYLAMIESGLNPRARSHAAAVGMWQFISATGRAYGLQVNHWVDERQDPEKATRAAARHLRDLYQQYGGDWHVAIAGYNCSPRCIRRAEQRARAQKPTGPITYWDMYPYLPRETRNYVPMFIATTLLLTNPDAFDLPPVDPGPRYAYDVAPVEGMLDLRQVADLAGTNVEMIRALNPEIRQWTTPPSRTPYTLRLPPGTRDRFQQAYAALPPEQRQTQTQYRVRRGDTLGKIAARYGTSVTALRELNGISGSLIHEGQQLYVPVQYAAYANAAPTDDQVSYDDPTPTTTASYTPSSSSSSTSSSSASGSGSRIRYQVRRGDSLTRIAQRYGVSISDLRRWNDLRSDRILAGQRLTIYTGDAAPDTPPVRTASQRDETVTYRVRRGDNLSTIARRHGVSVTDLRRWNDLRGDHIRSGQRLTIYPGRSSGTTAAKRWVAYRVKRGDTLTDIARAHGATVSEVRKWNDLRTDRIRVGQRLALYTNR